MMLLQELQRGNKSGPVMCMDVVLRSLLLFALAECFSTPKSCGELLPSFRIPKTAPKRSVASLSELYLGTDSPQQLVGPDFCMMSAIAADCQQLRVYVEEFSAVSFPFFFDDLVSAIKWQPHRCLSACLTVFCLSFCLTINLGQEY